MKDNDFYNFHLMIDGGKDENDDDDDDVDDVDGVDEVDDHHDFDNCNLIIDGGKYEDVEYEQRRPDGNGDAQGSRVGRKTSLKFIYLMLINLMSKGFKIPTTEIPTVLRF